jgi:Fe-S-cluster containining protein
MFVLRVIDARCVAEMPRKMQMILLLRTEAEHTAGKTTMSMQEFVERVEGFEPYVYKMRKTNKGKCNFLKASLCSIYEIKQ